MAWFVICYIYKDKYIDIKYTYTAWFVVMFLLFVDANSHYLWYTEAGDDLRTLVPGRTGPQFDDTGGDVFRVENYRQSKVCQDHVTLGR